MRRLAAYNDILKTKEKVMTSKNESIAIQTDVYVYNSTLQCLQTGQFQISE